MMRFFALSLVLFALAGCYRATPPPQLGESVRIIVTSNDARLVRSQLYLQQEIARAIEDKLAWTVSPTGSAKLAISISEEDIGSNASDVHNIPARWNIELKGHALLSSKRGHFTTDFSGTGSASNLAGEPTALQQAAQNVGASIAGWLETAGKKWK